MPTYDYEPKFDHRNRALCGHCDRVIREEDDSPCEECQKLLCEAEHEKDMQDNLEERVRIAQELINDLCDPQDLEP